MTDEVFALSPISARSTLPNEADYEAIKEAFMETSRGRWFLGEYAKRNRNADTSLVLDAVARIEETLAAQKKPSRDPLLDQALSAFRSALSEAKGAAQAALDHLAPEENLAPLRKGVRVIREIAWRLREIGADGRICDLIDSQISAIEGAAVKLAPTDLAATLTSAFDRIEGRIAAFDADTAGTSGPQPATRSAPKALNEAAQAIASVPSEELAEPHAAAQTPQDDLADIEAATAEGGEQAEAIEPLDAAPATAEGAPADTFDSDDEALLDLVAREMAAPDTDAAYEAPLDEAPAEQPPEAKPPNVRASKVKTLREGIGDKASAGERDVASEAEAL
ncbi:MAG TPA: hypothetical protein VKT76_13435, partial [Bradyrhizobium sp.]|nr:hypothetical protein [Bradyrhizobium sp.]